MKSVLAVVGPTASGKTELAIEFAERLGTEIISADSMQVYRGMEIGTAAPTPAQLERVRHHFIGVLDPGQEFSAGDFQRQAREIVERLNRDGKIAVVVGGSGLYASALIDGLFEGPPKDAAIRERLQEEALGRGSLYTQLESVDPAYASVIDSNDTRRIIRALEVYEITGRAISDLHREHQMQSPGFDAVQIALDIPRQVLYERINARVERMLVDGFVDEVRQLIELGYRDHLDRLRAVGYREFAAYIEGKQRIDEATTLMQQQTRRFAKRQLTWFRADKRILWLPYTGERFSERDIDSIKMNLDLS